MTALSIEGFNIREENGSGSMGSYFWYFGELVVNGDPR